MPPARRYQLPRVADQQVAKSRELILAAAAQVAPRKAAILGAGRCSEIPLADLVRRFERVVVNDREPLARDEILHTAGLTATDAGNIEWQVADLTGLVEPLAGAWSNVLAAAPDSSAGAEAMYRALKTTRPEPLPRELTALAPFDLVVASCMLSQLHNAALATAVRLFGERFPGEEERFRASQDTASAFYELARQVEARFIDHLASLTAPQGRIYLAETVQVCFLEPAGPQHWSTEGTLRMLRTANLADYLDQRFTVERSDRWPWVIEAEPPARSRLFDVQGLILSVRATV